MKKNGLLCFQNGLPKFSFILFSSIFSGYLRDPRYPDTGSWIPARPGVFTGSAALA